MKKILPLLLFFISVGASGQVAESFNETNVCSGSLPCWSADEINITARGTVPSGTPSLCNNPAIFDINTSAPIAGSGSLHTSWYANTTVGTPAYQNIKTLYSNASAADGDNVSFQFRINPIFYNNIDTAGGLYRDYSMITVRLFCGDFSYSYNYVPADSGIVQNVNQLITGSNGGGTVAIEIMSYLTTDRPGGIVDSLSYNLDLDNFSTTGPLDSLNNCNAIVLPLRLISFSGVNSDCTNKLQWKTAEETNFSHFEIQRSANGMQYAAIGIVHSQNNSSGSSYQFIDNEAKETNYYRLKMVDIDGRFDYSKVIKVNGCRNKSNVIIYPNPTVENVTVSGIKPGSMIQVISSIGQTLSSVTATLPTEVINTGKLSKGVYIISIIDKATGEKENYKIPKQ